MERQTSGRSPTEEIPRLVRQLYEVVRQLESLFPGRRFTPDGHLIGSIGEVLAAHYYGLDLYPGSEPKHDATAKDGRRVQIKATQGTGVGLRSEPETLLVIKLERDGTFDEVFNGPGGIAWEATGPEQKNGQSPISLSKLRRLMEKVPQGARIDRAT